MSGFTDPKMKRFSSAPPYAQEMEMLMKSILQRRLGQGAPGETPFWMGEGHRPIGGAFDSIYGGGGQSPFRPPAGAPTGRPGETSYGAGAFGRNSPPQTIYQAPAAGMPNMGMAGAEAQRIDPFGWSGSGGVQMEPSLARNQPRLEQMQQMLQAQGFGGGGVQMGGGVQEPQPQIEYGPDGTFNSTWNARSPENHSGDYVNDQQIAEQIRQIFGGYGNARLSPGTPLTVGAHSVPYDQIVKILGGAPQAPGSQPFTPSYPSGGMQAPAAPQTQQIAPGGWSGGGTQAPMAQPATQQITPGDWGGGGGGIQAPTAQPIGGSKMEFSNQPFRAGGTPTSPKFQPLGWF